MTVAGIDGSTTASGVSIMIDGKLVFYTLIKLKEKDTMKRIGLMLKEICSILDKYDVDIICMEKAFSKQNVDTTIKLAMLAGGIFMYCTMNDIEFDNPLPSSWRAKIGIKQAEGKHKVKRETLKEMAIKLVKQEYGINVGDDVSESILVARSKFDLPKLEISEDDLWS
jgi:Holliday junction resolvasome RuvABC endonuclease subunit